ncbi:uncharacterized protein HKW66_Vig0253080 [Vigna angularis]|uniref:DUF4408 domain-containing protein n=3 Tax=Phaseolus angularis TaxID=3914 RepID=A0A8T0K0X1_PHAAN|nr:uncharacterized protein LOC108337703 [Vigna angularis]KAG2390754.1 uncharacterized protein HKW66_Vig0253080 [Vigna angularis]BAT80602.1 hypothetical protein VIGAN_03019300 [Vigna angularis var. angularis]
MDQLKNQTITAFTQSLKAHYYLLMFTQLFVSVSVCSFLFSPSSLLVFLHYFKFYFSTFPSQLFTHNIDKNSMFLLCNGLLVFVGITKSLSRSSSDDKPSTFVKDDGSQSQFSVTGASDLMLEITETVVQSSEPDQHKNAAAEKVKERENCAEEEVLENVEKIIVVDEGLERGSCIVLKAEKEELDEETEQLDVSDGEQDKGSEIDYILIEESVEEEEEHAEEESSMLSTEELNKKFEDFIRKMKEDLRIEAQRQLVMV